MGGLVWNNTDENSQLYALKRQGPTDLSAPPNGYWRPSGGRQKVLFYVLSAGELSFFVKSMVQCTDE